MPLHEEIAFLADKNGFAYEIFINEKADPFHRNINKNILEKYINEESNQIFLITGGNSFFETNEVLLKNLGVQQQNIYKL